MSTPVNSSAVTHPAFTKLVEGFSYGGKDGYHQIDHTITENVCMILSVQKDTVHLSKNVLGDDEANDYVDSEEISFAKDPETLEEAAKFFEASADMLRLQAARIRSQNDAHIRNVSSKTSLSG